METQVVWWKFNEYKHNISKTVIILTIAFINYACITDYIWWPYFPDAKDKSQ